MRLKYVSPITFLIVLLLYVSGCQAPESEAVSPAPLTPSQVNTSMVDQVVRVRGKVLWVVQNPGGLGGIYAKLGDNSGEVGIRIQEEIWVTLNEREKAQFEKGKTATAEGILFKAGKELVIVFGRFSPYPQPSPTT